jgi:hypothetical protein
LLALLEPQESYNRNPGGFCLSKVRIRLVAPKKGDVEKLRKHMLKKHPQMILSNPKQGNNPKYDNWLCYGDYEFGKIRRRRSE